MKSIRADEIQHSTVIDVPMYEMLLQADVVIADLSTYNVNAAYELGVRYVATNTSARTSAPARRPASKLT